MKNKTNKLIDIIEKITYQGDFEYDFGYDVAQKIFFVLTLLVLWALPWSWEQYEFAVFIICCIVGRVLVMSSIQIWLNNTIEKCGGRKSDHRFLHMSSGLWKLIVLVFLIIITIRCLRYISSVEDALITITGCLTMVICGFFIYGGITNVAIIPQDPTKVGTAAWKKANGVEQVRFGWENPLWRDKNGNYYGKNFCPIPPPVNIIDNKK